MPGPHPAVAAVRLAVRASLPRTPQTLPLTEAPLVLVACSGGADSLALAAATAFEAPRAGVRAGAVVVDHGLQADSAEVAERAADQCRSLRLDPVSVARVADTDPGPGGPEANARAGRYRALESAAAGAGADAVLLGHTRDDQAEQVLLGLVRGAGARSLAGMPVRRGLFVRPLLGVDRADTRAACAAEGLTPWEDPHNADPRYTRVRVRDLVAELEKRVGPGVASALARTAAHLREDADALDAWAGERADVLGEPPWAASDLRDLPRALRIRLLRLACAGSGVPLGDLSAAHLDALDALLAAWRGQGPVHLPGGVRARRVDGRLVWDTAVDPAATPGPRVGADPGPPAAPGSG